jgi:hypothetical protein
MTHELTPHGVHLQMVSYSCCFDGSEVCFSSHMGKQIFRRSRILGEGVAPAGDDLQDEDAVAENVRFRREDAVQGVLRRHVPAVFVEGTARQCVMRKIIRLVRITFRLQA